MVKIMSFPKKDPRQDSVRSNTAVQCVDGDQSQAVLVQTKREEKGSQKPRARDSQVWLNAIQRLLCMGLAAWILLLTLNVWLFLLILAAGFIDAQLAKKILSGISAAIAGGVAGAIKASAPKD
jgi:hypothetical protein